MLMYVRVYQKSGNGRSKPTASLSKNRRKTLRPSLMLSHFIMSKTRSEVTNRFIINSTMPGSTTALSSSNWVLVVRHQHLLPVVMDQLEVHLPARDSLRMNQKASRTPEQHQRHQGKRLKDSV